MNVPVPSTSPGSATLTLHVVSGQGSPACLVQDKGFDGRLLLLSYSTCIQVLVLIIQSDSGKLPCRDIIYIFSDTRVVHFYDAVLYTRVSSPQPEGVAIFCHTYHLHHRSPCQLQSSSPDMLRSDIRVTSPQVSQLGS